jgi:hypothetical protein
VGRSWHQQRKPALVFLGSQTDPFSATERWSIVKAFDQFGAFSGLRVGKGATGFGITAAVPSFDWTQAIYRSSYVLFEHSDGQHPTRADQALYQRYAHLFPTTEVGPYPLVFVGGYVMRGADVAPGELAGPQGQTLSFEEVQRAMQHGYGSGTHFIQYVYDLDAEANVITALICHADGKRPARVCTRPAIKTILREMR